MGMAILVLRGNSQCQTCWGDCVGKPVHVMTDCVELDQIHQLIRYLWDHIL